MSIDVGVGSSLALTTQAIILLRREGGQVELRVETF